MINPLIPLSVETPDIAQALFRGQNQLDRREAHQSSLQTAEKNRELMDSRLETEQQQREVTASEQEIKSRAMGALDLKRYLDASDIQGGLAYLEQREQGLVADGRNADDTRHIKELLLNGQVDDAKFLIDSAVNTGTRLGYIKSGTKQQFGAGQTIKDSKGNLFDVTQKRNPTTGQVEQVYSPYPNSPDAPVGDIQIVGTQGLTADESIEHARLKTGAKTEGNLETQAKLLPQIRKAIKIAETEGKAEGDANIEYKKAKAAQPGLEEVVEQLRGLAPVATHTYTGRAFNFLVKETGFGATKGATARTAFQAIIDNQVLPLLKPTFGAAFSVQEGEALRATMGDVNKTPKEKVAALEAFIEQKYRDLDRLQTETSPANNVDDEINNLRQKLGL